MRLWKQSDRAIPKAVGYIRIPGDLKGSQFLLRNARKTLQQWAQTHSVCEPIPVYQDEEGEGPPCSRKALHGFNAALRMLERHEATILLVTSELDIPLELAAQVAHCLSKDCQLINISSGRDITKTYVRYAKRHAKTISELNLAKRGAGNEGHDNTPILSTPSEMIYASQVEEMEAHPRQTEDLLPVFAAVSDGDISLLRHLLQAGADPNQTAPNGITALSQAAVVGRADLAELLLEHGADIDRASNGRTALHVASQWGHRAVIEFLADRGANLNARREDGRTPLDLAADSAVQRFLLGRGGQTADQIDRGEPAAEQGEAEGATLGTNFFAWFILCLASLTQGKVVPGLPFWAAGTVGTAIFLSVGAPPAAVLGGGFALLLIGYASFLHRIRRGQ